MKLNLVLSVSLDDEMESDVPVEPITLQEAKDWLKISVSDDDDLIIELITAARQQCEHYLNISLIQRTVHAQLQNQIGGIELPYGPVNDIIEIKDQDGNEITDYTLSGINFKTLNDSNTGNPTPQNNFYTPSNSYVDITYSAGYERLPKHFKTAILKQVAFLYQNRGDETINAVSNVLAADQLSPVVLLQLKPYRRVV